jgi:hypothetical protein
MSSIAVFLVLGGATAFAATKIGAGQLKANSVKTGKIVKEAVTEGKIKNGAVTTNKIANDAVTGAKVNEATLGQVPSAATATTAGSANSVAGNTVRRIFFKSGPNQGVTTILSLNGLTLTAKCTANVLAANATTAVSNTIIRSGGTFGGATAFYTESDNFDAGENFDFLANGTTTSDSLQGTLTYATPEGTVVTAVFAAEELGFGGEGCAIAGYATG